MSDRHTDVPGGKRLERRLQEELGDSAKVTVRRALRGDVTDYPTVFKISCRRPGCEGISSYRTGQPTSRHQAIDWWRNHVAWHQSQVQS